jgi:hypothetical protein
MYLPLGGFTCWFLTPARARSSGRHCLGAGRARHPRPTPTPASRAGAVSQVPGASYPEEMDRSPEWQSHFSKL